MRRLDISFGNTGAIGGYEQEKIEQEIELFASGSVKNSTGKINGARTPSYTTDLMGIARKLFTSKFKLADEL